MSDVSISIRRPAPSTPTSGPDDWREQAACYGVDFMTLWGYTEQAKKICERCPVLKDCLAWVVEEQPLIPGVLAGLSAQQRGLRECKFCQMPIPRRAHTPRRDVCRPCYDAEVRPNKKNEPRRPTLADVADLAGVSRPAAGYVFNGCGSVSDELRAKVLAAAEQLGYEYQAPWEKSA